MRGWIHEGIDFFFDLCNTPTTDRGVIPLFFI